MVRTGVLLAGSQKDESSAWAWSIWPANHVSRRKQILDDIPLTGWWAASGVSFVWGLVFVIRSKSKEVVAAALRLRSEAPTRPKFCSKWREIRHRTKTNNIIKGKSMLQLWIFIHSLPLLAILNVFGNVLVASGCWCFHDGLRKGESRLSRHPSDNNPFYLMINCFVTCWLLIPRLNICSLTSM